MNLFNILSSGDGSINEPNITSILAYLLNPNEDHGFKDVLLKLFLEEVLSPELKFKNELANISLCGDEDIITEIQIEEALRGVVNKQGKKRKRDIDIVIRFYFASEDEKQLFLVVPIENKIKVGSALDRFQLNDEYKLIENFSSKETYLQNPVTNSAPFINFVYLTPDVTNKKIQENFNNLIVFASENSQLNHFEINLQWERSTPKNIVSVYDMLTTLLKREYEGDINSVSPYSLLLVKNLKAFIREFIQSADKVKPYWKLVNNAPKPVEKDKFWENWKAKSTQVADLAYLFSNKLNKVELKHSYTITRLSLESNDFGRVCALREDISTLKILRFDMNIKTDTSVSEFIKGELPAGVSFNRKKNTLLVVSVVADLFNSEKDYLRESFITLLNNLIEDYVER